MHKQNNITEVVGLWTAKRHQWGDVIIGDMQIVNPETGEPSDFASAKGKDPREELTVSGTYVFFGRWGEYRGKKQFLWSTFAEREPLTRRGVVAYFQRIPGIGPTRAEKIWQAFRSDSLRIGEHQPELLVAKCGLKEDVADEVSRWLAVNKQTSHTKVRLIGMLANHGLPLNLTDRLIYKWGAKAANMVEEWPHRLCLFKGVGFARADQIYLSLGGDPNRVFRQSLAAWNDLRASNDHTWYLAERCIRTIYEQIGSAAKPKQALKLAKRFGAIEFQRTEEDEVTLSDTGKVVWACEKAKADQERTTAAKVAEAMNDRPQWESPADSIEALTDHQREQLRVATSKAIGCLTGWAGTGKSYVIGRLVNHLADCHGVGRIALVAPTGKAAVRMTEAVADAGCHLKATTIHSFLRLTPSEDGDEVDAFDHGTGAPNVDFIIVDESPMVSTPLAARLMAAKRPGCCILWAGDLEQLGPIDHGAPFRDMCHSAIPTGHLSKVRRASGEIVDISHKIVKDEPFELHKPHELDLDNGINWIHVECESNMQMSKLETVIKMAATHFDIDPIWEAQVVCATNRSETCGRPMINRMMQNLFNEHPPHERWPFRPGDKVINRVNGKVTRVRWEPATRRYVTNKDDKVYSANGDIGKVLALEDKSMVVELQNNPKVMIRVPRSPHPGDRGTHCNFELSYGITTHLSQGSEYPLSIVVLDENARMLNTKNWMITAVTRGKQMCVTIGKERVLREAIRKRMTEVKKTFLRQRIAQAIENYVDVYDNIAADMVGVVLEPLPKLERAIKTNKCVFCRRELTHENSKRLGFGPTCAKKNGLPWGDEVTIEIAAEAMKGTNDAVDTETAK